MSDQDPDFGAFLAGFIIGSLAGAAAALLMAPQSGEETRTMIREKGIELKDRAVETYEEALTRAEKALEEARVKAEQAIEETRLRAEEMANLAKEKAADLQQRGQVVLEEQKSRIGSTADSARQAGQQAANDIQQGLDSASPTSGEVTSP
jgi:gas vesicle protein